jgi:protein-S-isoprenylcysteine O-methyltransferase Ste14
MNAKVWLAVTVRAIFAGALLFVAAGTWRWPAAWLFALAVLATGLGGARWLASHDPELLAERMKPLVQPGQPLWDRIVMGVMSAMLVSWLVVIGIDAGRYQCSALSGWLRALGGVGLAIGMWISARTFRANTFLSAVVKIQRERGHRVVSTGPYAVVRHPLYAGLLLVLPSIALVMGSLWGLGATSLLATGVIVRTASEDRELLRGLEGYVQYAERVRYRLVPWIW